MLIFNYEFCGKFENKVKKWLDANNIWHFKVWGGLFQKAGIPDIIDTLLCECAQAGKILENQGYAIPFQKEDASFHFDYCTCI